MKGFTAESFDVKEALNALTGDDFDGIVVIRYYNIADDGPGWYVELEGYPDAGCIKVSSDEDES